jgi:hypothetical protein
MEPICISRAELIPYVKNTSQRLSKPNYEIRPEKCSFFVGMRAGTRFVVLSF